MLEGSPDTGARYYARGGKVYARTPDGKHQEAGTALSANGRELDRHDRALSNAKAQRAQQEREQHEHHYGDWTGRYVASGYEKRFCECGAFEARPVQP